MNAYDWEILLLVMKLKGSKDVLSSIVKTAQMGQVGIRSVLDTNMRPGLRSALESQLREYDSIEKNRDLPIGEDIGNGILRVNLAALKPEDLERLGAVFLRSAAEHTGDPARFLEKLDVLRTLTREGVFAFGTQELESYLDDYGRAGYPPVSHSDFYREKYKPAYRIVLRKYWEATE